MMRQFSVVVILAHGLSLPGLAGPEDKYRHWSARFEGGWQAALQLHPKSADGIQRGNLFWLTDQRGILWRENANSIFVMMQKPWSDEAADIPQLVFRKQGDGLRMAKEALSELEANALVDVVWQNGGPEPGTLASSHDDNSPYSRSHESGNFILDVSKVPTPLARCAIRIFHDDTRRMAPWIKHPELPEELFTSLLAETDKATDPNDNAAASSAASIRSMMATNPNVPRAVLEELWNRPTQPVWGAGLKLRISEHPRDQSHGMPWRAATSVSWSASWLCKPRSTSRMMG